MRMVYSSFKGRDMRSAKAFSTFVSVFTSFATIEQIGKSISMSALSFASAMAVAAPSTVCVGSKVSPLPSAKP